MICAGESQIDGETDFDTTPTTNLPGSMDFGSISLLRLSEETQTGGD